MKVLFTGGSGLLGKTIRHLAPEFAYPTRSVLDVTNYQQALAYMDVGGFDTVVHTAAFISPPRVDKNPVEAVTTNIIGTSNIVTACFQLGGTIRIIYISTDYVFDGERGGYKEDDSVHPVNKYAWSKLGGECAVRCYDNSLIVRTSFGTDEFMFSSAWEDHRTSRIAVSEFANYLLRFVDHPELRGIMHVGAIRPRTVYEFAKDISPGKDIGRRSRKEVDFVPADTSLDTSRFWKFMANERIEL
jgi:dTDP-4-dehydrorhamnose reductase